MSFREGCVKLSICAIHFLGHDNFFLKNRRIQSQTNLGSWKARIFGRLAKFMEILKNNCSLNNRCLHWKNWFVHQKGMCSMKSLTCFIKTSMFIENMSLTGNWFLHWTKNCLMRKSFVSFENICVQWSNQCFMICFSCFQEFCQTTQDPSFPRS